MFNSCPLIRIIEIFIPANQESLTFCGRNILPVQLFSELFIFFLELAHDLAEGINVICLQIHNHSPSAPCDLLPHFPGDINVL